jgi:hypothetical protein
MSFSSSFSGSSLPTESPTSAPTPTPGYEGGALGPRDASTDTLRDALEEPVLIEIESDAGQLLSSAVTDGLSDPYSPAQGGWNLGSQQIDPYTGGDVLSDGLDAFVGQNVDSFTAAADGQNSNWFTGGQDINPFTGFQNVSFSGSVLMDAAPTPASSGPTFPGDSASGARYASPDVVANETLVGCGEFCRSAWRQRPPSTPQPPAANPVICL